ncbi:hypothetical protein [Flavobacterium sp.]|uniref:hypothetical protein n=1 Tax=Flavobacterium sp. TaxID=239 RepID=UPI00260E2636|nr:hypothetical protein [Flavobacterium sp.]MDD3005364.1 hypothetical protein [Flavobacterium sp.]
MAIDITIIKGIICIIIGILLITLFKRFKAKENKENSVIPKYNDEELSIILLKSIKFYNYIRDLRGWIAGFGFILLGIFIIYKKLN